MSHANGESGFNTKAYRDHPTYSIHPFRFYLRTFGVNSSTSYFE